MHLKGSAKAFGLQATRGYRKPNDFALSNIQYVARLSRNPFYSTSGILSQSTGSVDVTEILFASRRAALHDFMALSYGPARGLAYDRRRGFRAWVDRDDRHGRNFCLVHCYAYRSALKIKPS